MLRKIVICAEYQGTGAAFGTVTGFQLAVENLIEEAGRIASDDVVVFCLGDGTRTYPHPQHANVTFRQYQPWVSPQELAPFASTKVLPFRVELWPWRGQIVRDIVSERPDVIHTFQTIGATDMAGLIATKRLRRRGHSVRLISSVMTEIETYITSYFATHIHECCEYSRTHSFFEQLRAAWRMDGITPVRSNWYRALMVVANVFCHPACRTAGSFHRLVDRWRLQRPDSRQKPRAKTGTRFQRMIRSLAHRQIAWYLKQADVVTTSRPSDAVNYQIPIDRVWHMPLSCDTEKFQPANETIASVRALADEERNLGRLDTLAHAGLTKFLDRIESDPTAFAIVTVGRLSDEKNLWLLSRAFRKFSEATTTRNVYWLACGTGLWDAELVRQFPDQVSLAGLVPNGLLPAIFNLARSRRFVYISASDTETYGITHEESQRCGLPLIAMELGTRGHFYFPGDRVGKGLTVPLDSELEHDVQRSLTSSAPLYCAANGLCVPDLSEGRGLNALRDSKNTKQKAAIHTAVDSLAQAMLAMERLPAESWHRMSENAIALTEQTKVRWRLIWQLLSEGMYSANRDRYSELMTARGHLFQSRPTISVQDLDGHVVVPLLPQTAAL